MLTARRIGGPCSRCRQDLLHLFEYGFVGPSAVRRAPAHAGFAPLRSFHASRSRKPSPQLAQQRPFSTTKPSARDATPDASQDPKDIETIVRQAKALFGDTLPKDYLSPEEYKVYERLFGAPLRETTPQDVGIPFKNETSGPILLREAPNGTLEEVEYDYDPSTNPEALEENEELDQEEEDIFISDEQLELEEDDADVEVMGADLLAAEAIRDDLPTDPRLDYMDVIAKNEREYDALLKLKADFEAASLQAIEEEERQRIIEAEAQATGSEGEVDFAELSHEELERLAYRDQIVEEWEQFDDGIKAHELTVEGRFRTSPATIQIPKQDFVQPITELLKRTDPTHLKEGAEAAFGGRGLPFSARIPHNMLDVKQIGISLQANQGHMSEIEADAYIATVLPTVYATATSILVEVRKRLGTEWLRDLLRKNDGLGPRVLDAGAAGASMLAWQHVVRAEWEAMKSEGEALADSEAPLGKRTVLVGSNFLRHRVSTLFENTTFLPRLPDYLHSAENVQRQLDAPAEPRQRKTYDVIVVSHMLMAQAKQYRRKELIDNLWAHLNPDGGVLVVLEKGHPRGFEAVADVRQRMLDEFIVAPGEKYNPEDQMEPENDGSGNKPKVVRRIKEPGMIIAPCTNHTKCPMYPRPGYTHGRKDFCHFGQRFIRPPFFQRILGESHANHEDVSFSYLALRRGGHRDPRGPADAMGDPAGPWQGKAAADRAHRGYGEPEEAEAEVGSDGVPQRPSMLSLPRNIRPPLKGRGHVTMDVCTPAGALERWTVPKSLGKQAYHDARKVRWGDLWALGAKQREARTPRLGRPGAELLTDLANPLGPGKGDGGVRARRALEDAGSGEYGGGKRKPRVIDVDLASSGAIAGASERIPRNLRRPAERRTRGGRDAAKKELVESIQADLDDEDSVDGPTLKVRKGRDGRRRGGEDPDDGM
ncbi:hypothetical protein RB601_000625 [Gaeumannomyces tritici]